ncbi:hypothetical protein [Pseudomonas benzenivorans]|uniref:Uncharacterized protein n=1 Tax=Pseudomonas benzenivorans TaxID=556533 RepID=A0ABY5H7W8_9PSED|nr:hypothetical protein [Pseudomonas benzenivorans]UTW07519.1 hypothetical protein KDW96_20630 [Pseudomonas benzenivorans]
MNSDNPETYDLASAPPSDEQRLERLEKGRRVDRIVLIGLALMLVVVLASWSTATLLRETSPGADAQQLQDLQNQQLLLEKKLAALEQQNNQLVAAQGSKTLSTAPVVNSPDAIQQVAKTLIGQEQSYQKSLAALKTGMGELAGMIPGSRSWLDYYNEILDKPLAESRARAEELKQWSAGPELTSAGKPAANRSAP